MAVEEDSFEEGGKKDVEAEVRPWEAVCGRSHHDKVKVLDSMVAASEHPVG